MARLLLLFSFITFIVGCEFPVDEETTLRQSSLAEVDTEEEVADITEDLTEDLKKDFIDTSHLFNQSFVYDVKYTYTVDNCVGKYKNQYNTLTYEILGQIVVLDEKHIIMTRQQTSCPHKIGVYAQWNSSSDIIDNIQGDFLIGDHQDWSKSYGRINISGGNSGLGIQLSGYIRNIKIDHRNTLCIIDELTISHGLHLENVDAQNVLCEELKQDVAVFVKESTST